MASELLRALVLSADVESGDDLTLARASRAAIVLDAGLERLPHEEWLELTARCREALRPDGVLALRMAPHAAVDHRSLREVLAHSFGAVDLFAWDGLRRRSTQDLHDLFALCWPYLPYAMRTLELLRPRVLADGPEWRSSWLCERPGLPERFLLRATLDVIGGARGFGLRLRFLTSTSARFKIEGHIGPDELTDGTAELLVASALATARGEPAWAHVRRIALDIRGDGGEPVDVRLSDVRICADPAARRVEYRRVVDSTSADLREGYDAGYYQDMSGYGLGRDLREHVNLHRAYALLPEPAPARVVDVGAARGELAGHLIEQGAEVTLLDYSATAMDLARGLIGERPGARYVLDDAANLGAHVPAQSQDAIFMTDFVEHVTVDELRPILGACRRALALDGVLVIHTPERYCGAIVTAKAIHGLHLQLFEIDSLRELLEEFFGAVEVFTWDGFERFYERGYCIELFALARPEAADAARQLPVTPIAPPSSDVGARDQREDAPHARRAACAIEHPRLPSRFILDAIVEIDPATAGGELEVVFQSATGETLARAGRKLSQLRTLPVQLRLASELLAPAAPPRWGEVERIVVSVDARGGGPIALTLRDVSLAVAVP